MFERIAKLLCKRNHVPDRVILKTEGFALYRGSAIKGGVDWREIDKITVFKEDLLTYDVVCMEFMLGAKNEVFEVNDDVEGFWGLVKRIKEVFPTSRQDWEAVVLKPAFDRNPTVVYERRANS
jgi:hypothetical protein